MRLIEIKGLPLFACPIFKTLNSLNAKYMENIFDLSTHMIHKK